MNIGKTECKGGDCIELDEDKTKWLFFMHTVMDIWFHKAENFLSTEYLTGFKGKAVGYYYLVRMDGIRVCWKLYEYS